MRTLRTATLSLAALTAVLVTSGPALGSGGGGGSGTWPAAYPLPLNPGHVLSQTSSTAVVRSTDPVVTVKSKLDAMYVNQLGCRRVVAVNKPRDYLCGNAEIWFTFAALDPKPTDPSRSQTNAYRG